MNQIEILHRGLNPYGYSLAEVVVNGKRLGDQTQQKEEPGQWFLVMYSLQEDQNFVQLPHKSCGCQILAEAETSPSNPHRRFDMLKVPWEKVVKFKD